MPMSWAESIWFPFTDRPWTKTWTVRPIRPSRSRPVDTPYNYPFTDNVPKPVANLVSKLVKGAPRVSGLDHAGDVNVVGAQAPTLSAVTPDPSHPEWDVAIWLDLLTFPDTPYAGRFYREIEEFVFTNYRAPYAVARAEWSKGWGCTVEGAWSAPTVLTRTIPDTFGIFGNDSSTNFFGNAVDPAMAPSGNSAVHPKHSSSPKGRKHDRR